MYARLLTIGALLVASIGFFLSTRPNETSTHVLGQYIQGRNKTVLFLANREHGLSNVHIATASALLENYPDIELHYASFASVRSKLDRISHFARARQPSTGDVLFHELKGLSFEDAFFQNGGDINDMIHPPGSKGLGGFLKNLQRWIEPWTVEQHLDLYHQISAIIDEVDPAVIVLDTFLPPGIDITRDRDRQHVMITPNPVSHTFTAKQPRGAMLWKYPAVPSGLKFPLPLRDIPENVVMVFRTIGSLLSGSDVANKRAALRKAGLKKPIDYFGRHRDDVPWISSSMEDATIPIDFVPLNVTSAGPIVLDSAPAEEQDAEMAAWLKRAPTVLVNLGSLLQYDQDRAAAMSAAIADVLSKSDVQVIWKFRKLGDYSDDALAPLTPFIESGRLRVSNWLAIDPTSMLNTGDIIASVHHGGANCYHETVLSGVPHIILPLWADLYSYAVMVEDLGIGVWGCKASSPVWTADCLSNAVFDVIGQSDAATTVRNKAEAIGKTVQAREKGRDVSAREISKLAYIK